MKICSIEDCYNKCQARGWCSKHYGRWRLHGSPHILLRPPVTDKKLCVSCGEEKLRAADFYSRSGTYCKECTKTYNKIRRIKNPDYNINRDTKADYIRLMYGLTLQQRDELLETQGGGCAICGTHDSGTNFFHLDHDHNCCPGKRSCGKCIRGLLCTNCNRGLGHLKDDIFILESALYYLNKKV